MFKRRLTLKKQDSSANQTASDDTSSILTPPIESKLKLSKPRRSERLKDLEIPSDDDIWVERFYRNTKGRKIYYYCSVHTGKRQLLEPPTGAALILRECHYNDIEILVALPSVVRRVVMQHHTREELLAIPSARPKRSKRKKTYFFGLLSK